MRQSGFTVIELLFVVAIIGLLAGIIISNVLYARARARDTRRITDVRSLETAIEIYRSSANAIPDVLDIGPEDNTGGVDVGNPGFRSDHLFLKQLVDAGVLKQPIIDVDDRFLGDHSYYYFKYPSGSFETPGCTKSFAVLAIRLENPQTGYKIGDEVLPCFAASPEGVWTTDDHWLAFTIEE